MKYLFGPWRVTIITTLLCGAAQAGSLLRVANTTLRMPPQPAIGSAAYNTITDFAGINWETPLDIRFPPGETNRLFVAEETGRIIVITNLANPTRTVFL